ncbi:MAG TPA: T9SS type A sorting domain-containing protein [Bacteroidia bacterium]|nr:T9SS type A sorting domain-containing protein [Bacteroidia bacterium]
MAKISMSQTLEYRFHNNFDESNHDVSALSPLTSGNFQNDLLNELTCAQQTVYHFDLHHGLKFDNNHANGFISNNYSIELYFKFDNTGGYRKIINYKSPLNDSGLYYTGSVLDFFPAYQINTTAFDQGQYGHLIITRDASTKEVSLYIDGTLGGSFIDADDLGSLDSANILNFFVDDHLYEESSGNIALLRLYNYRLSASEITYIFNNLHNDLSPVTFSTYITSKCLSTNEFHFTNTFQDDTTDYQFSWDFGDGSSSVGFDAVHSYSIPGTYTVTLTGASTTCTDGSSVQITIYPDPQLNLGNDTSFCAGNSLILDAGAGFAYYLWDDNSISQYNSVTSTGMYYVQVIDSNGCENTDEINITINALPQANLGNDTTFCDGNILVLDAGNGYSSYLWNNNSTTQTISVGNSGTYSVQVTDNNGCSNSDNMTVTVNPLPPPAVIIQQGDSLVSNSLSGNQWYNMNGAIAGANNISYHPSASGNYFTIITDVNGCKSDTSNVIYYSPLGISYLKQNGFSIYPNPASDFIIINFTNTQEKHNITLSNIIGTILSNQYYNSDSGMFKLDVSDLTPGIYMITIKTKSEIYTQKLIIK